MCVHVVHRYKVDQVNNVDAGAEGSSGAEWLHGHLRRRRYGYGDVYVNQGEELAIRLFELEAIPFHFFFIFF